MSNLTPILRRWIKVGGGRLFSDVKGDVLLKCPDGSSRVLRDVLLVEGLGVNLLSAKKFCERNNATGISDDRKMLFKDQDNKIILSARLEDGLYKVDHVYGSGERALIGQENDSSKDDETQMKIDENIENEAIDDGKSLMCRADILEKRRAERFWLHHRRCGHAGPRVISLLHKITDIDRLIKILSNKNFVMFA